MAGDHMTIPLHVQLHGDDRHGLLMVRTWFLLTRDAPGVVDPSFDLSSAPQW